jgi:hypothetical protein
MSKPTHIAYVVIPPKEGSDKKAIYGLGFATLDPHP